MCKFNILVAAVCFLFLIRTGKARKEKNNRHHHQHVVVVHVLTVMTIQGCSFCSTLSSISRWKEASFSTTNTNLASECISSQRQGQKQLFPIFARCTQSRIGIRQGNDLSTPQILINSCEQYFHGELLNTPYKLDQTFKGVDVWG